MNRNNILASKTGNFLYWVGRGNTSLLNGPEKWYAMPKCYVVCKWYAGGQNLHEIYQEWAQPGKLKGTLDKTGYGTETYTYQTKSPTWPANTGKK